MSSRSNKDYGKVAVLMGGQSGEREISLKSGNAVLKALRENNIDAHGIDVDNNIFSLLMSENYDRVFIALHGCGGEDGTIQGGLKICDIPFTGSGVMASSICMNKIMTKQIWKAADIRTPDYLIISETTSFEQLVSALGVPFIVKPSREGSSLGIHKVENETQYATAVQEASSHQGALMAEQWIDGSEYTVAILGNTPLPVIKLETPREFYDFEAKYKANDTQYILPSGLDHDLEENLKEQAMNAFVATDASGWGRVDVMVDHEKNNWFLEVNTVPGMTDHSLVPMAAAGDEINFKQLVMKILDTSFEAEK